jgi:hypothetical protein
MFSRYLRGKIPEQASGSARQGLPLWLSRILNCSQAEPPICSSSFRGLSFPETRLVSGSPLGGRKVSIHTTLPARRHRFWIGRCRICPRRSLSAACGRLSPRRRPKDSRHAPRLQARPRYRRRLEGGTGTHWGDSTDRGSSQYDPIGVLRREVGPCCRGVPTWHRIGDRIVGPSPLRSEFHCSAHRYLREGRRKHWSPDIHERRFRDGPRNRVGAELPTQVVCS